MDNMDGKDFLRKPKPKTPETNNKTGRVDPNGSRPVHPHGPPGPDTDRSLSDLAGTGHSLGDANAEDFANADVGVAPCSHPPDGAITEAGPVSQMEDQIAEQPATPEGSAPPSHQAWPTRTGHAESAPHRAPTQEQVLRALSLRPGASPADIQRLTGRAWGVLDHAIYTLCKQHRVRVVEVRGKRRFYLAGHENSDAYVLSRPCLKVLHAVRLHPWTTTNDLARLTGMDKAEVSRAAVILAQAGWIERIRKGRSRIHIANAPHFEGADA